VRVHTIGVLTVFRRRFLYGVLWLTAIVFVLAVILNGGTGQIRTPLAALIATLYAGGMTMIALALFAVPAFRAWALEPPARLGKAGIWVGATILGGVPITIAAALRYLELLS